MSGQQIGTVLGGVIGAFFGMPQLGMAIGGFIGGVVDPTVIDGPKIGEIPQQTAQEGTPKPIIFARSQPIAGNVIFDAPPNIVNRTESQGKGGPKVKTQSAYRTYAVGVCEGSEGGVVLLQAWKNGQLVFDVEDPGMASNNAEFLKYVRWFPGTYDQMPSPDLEAKHGVGNVHAFRGTAYAVMVEEDVTDQRGAWSQWMWRVGRFTQQPPGMWWAIRVPDNGDENNRFLWRGESALAFGAGENRGPPNVDFALSGNGGSVVRTPAGGVILFGGNDQIELYEGATQDLLPDPTLVTIISGVLVNRIRSFSDILVATFAGADANRYAISTNGGHAWDEYPTPDNLLVSDIGRLENGRWVCYMQRNADQRFLYSDDDLPTSWTGAESEVYPSNASGSICVIENTAIMMGTNGRVFKTVGGSSWTSSAVFTADVSSGRCSKSAEGIVIFADPNSNNIARSEDKGGTWETIPMGRDSFGVEYGNGQWVLCGEIGADTILVSEEAGVSGSWIPSDMPSSAAFNQGYFVGFVEPAISYRDGYIPLPQVVTELSARVNAHTHIDVSDLNGLQVRGFTVTNTYPCYSALQALSQAFFFSPTNADGRLKFVRLGADTVATIYDADLIDNGEEVDAESKRGDTITIPRVLHLNYYDIDGGLTTDKQRSERPEGTRSTGEQSIQTSVVLSADEAATIIAKNHAMLVEQQKGELTFTLPDNWLRLTESDPVFIEIDTKVVRAVIQKVDTDDGEQKYRAIRDRQSIHTMQVEGTPAAPVTRPPSNVVGPTRIEVLDVPLWRDQDDKLGFWVAVSGVFPAWNGATVEMSTDGGASYASSASTNVSAIMGRTTSVLGDHPQEYPDTVNTVQVSISTPDIGLEGTDLAGMLNLQNLALIGDELIQFADVDEVSEGVWDLSYFLRGRKASTPIEHAIGERFVMLNSAVFFVPAALVLRNKTLTFRAISFGTTVEDAVITSITFVGRNQVERPAAYLQAHRDGTDVVATWQGVGRLGGGSNAAQGLYFTGFHVTLTDGSVTQTFDQTGDRITKSLAAFTGPVTVRVQQRNSITGLGPAIEVII